MRICSIDPGTTESAWLVFDTDEKKVLDLGLTPNEILVDSLLSHRRDGRSAHLIVEVFKSYGNIVGDSVLNTCEWIGRFRQAYGERHTTRYTRKEIVSHVCHNSRANDANVRQALLDRFPATGGGKNPAVGTKSKPGPLYGVKKDIWSALAIAVTYTEKNSFLF